MKCRTKWCNEEHAFEVDGVVYEPCLITTHIREIMEYIDPHPWELPYQCPLCNTDEPVRSWHHMTSDGMRWSPDYPIIRFTSEGLQIEETVKS